MKRVMNLKVMLDEAVRRYGEKTAIVFGGRRLAYAELDEASNKVANALLKRGLARGDRVAMLLTNSPEFAVTFFGIVKAGAIAVPLDTRYKLDELAALFNDSQPKVLVAESPYLEPLVPILPGFKSIEHVLDISSGGSGQFLGYQDIMASGSARSVEVELGAEDTAVIFYTSGPTSHPKGVILSHESLVVEAAISGSGFEQSDKDIVALFALPLYHVFGLEIVLLTSLAEGSTVVMQPGISLSSLWEAIERERVTIFMGVPYIFALAVNMAEREGIKHDLSSLRLCVSGGAALPVSLMERFRQCYGLKLAQLYGLTESVAHITCQPVDGTGKPGSVGGALPGWEVKAVDEGGRELPPDQPGEIIVKGPLMKGYYADPEGTARVMKDGWLYTGDIGRIDRDGEVFLLGLKKEMIQVKGQNVYPVDIEAVLRTHPKVAEAAVVGIPDEMRGEKIRAVVSLADGQRATEPELQEFCRRHLANYKVPKQFMITHHLPRNTAGGIDKEALKKA